MNNKMSPLPYVRLNKVEEEMILFKDSLEEIKDTLKEIRIAIVGDIEGQKRGILRRLEIVESFKTIICWIVGAMFLGFIAMIADVIAGKVVP